MSETLISIYLLSQVAFAVFDVWLAYRAYRHKGKTRGAVSIAMVCLSASLTTLTYLGSIVCTSMTAVSVFSSLHFASIDLLLFSLFYFSGQLTERRYSALDKICIEFMAVYGAFDLFALVANPLTGWAVTYTENPGAVLTHFSYTFHLFYYGHLVYDYIIVAIIIHVVLDKAIHTPRQYRDQYLYFLLALVVIVGINFIYLFIPVEGAYRWLDISILGYSLGLFIIYWSLFRYTHSAMLAKLSRSVFLRIDTAMVMFDNNGYLVMQNAKAVELFGDLEAAERLSIYNFIRLCKMPSAEGMRDDQYYVQCNITGGRGDDRIAYCQYYKLRNDKGDVLGHVFLFDDHAEEIDPLTGFLSWTGFEKYLQSNQKNMIAGMNIAVAIFDVNGLEETNDRNGRETGDAKLVELSELIRGNIPKASLYIRGRNAELIVASYDTFEREMIMNAERIREQFGGGLEFGVAMSPASGQGPDLMEAAAIAERSMKNKKLIDAGASHSQILSSLVRALQESDSDTEAHVKRTQRMGYELGLRLDLKDIELSRLSLLCLLHDIGKVGVPLEILNKPGKLTRDEWKVLQSHARKGYEIAMSSKETEDIAEMILHHHERWEGGGYPDGIAGEEIPLLSRIISVVDAYDAMVNDRIYRKAMSNEKALEELDRCAGTQFDPAIVAEFKKLVADHPEFMDMMVKGATVEVGLSGTILPQVYERTDVISSRNMSRPMPCGKYILDNKDYFLSCDAAFEEITGYKSAELTERRVMQMDFIPREDEAEYAQITAEQLQKYNMANIRHRFIKADGSTMNVLCYGRRYFDSSVKAMRVEILITDLDAPAEENRTEETQTEI